MNLENIETFLTVEKTRNITAAARQLYVSQSTVSHRLQLLEEELGTSLFIRNRGIREISLTPQGEAFITIAQQWMALFKDTQQLKEQFQSRVLNIGAVSLVNEYAFIPFYQKFIETHPMIRLKLLTYHSGELKTMLENHQIDIGFVYSIRKSPDIITKEMFKEEMILVTTRDNSYHEGISTAELDPDKEVHIRWGEDYARWHDDHFDKPCLLSASTGLQAIRFLNVKDRWSIIPLSIYRSIENKEDYAIYHLKETPPERTCFQITHKYPKPSSVDLIEEFIRELDQFIANM